MQQKVKDTWTHNWYSEALKD